MPQQFVEAVKKMSGLTVSEEGLGPSAEATVIIDERRLDLVRSVLNLATRYGMDVNCLQRWREHGTPVIGIDFVSRP